MRGVGASLLSLLILLDGSTRSASDLGAVGELGCVKVEPDTRLPAEPPYSTRLSGALAETEALDSPLCETLTLAGAIAAGAGAGAGAGLGAALGAGLGGGLLGALAS